VRNNENDNLNRRDFLRGAAGAGITAALSGPAAAQGERPVKGGHLVLGLGGGATTDSYDPATYNGPVPINYGRLWGENLIDTNETGDGLMLVLAESYEAIEGTRVWRFNIRRGIEFHNGQPLTADDVVKSLQRHSDENSQSPAFGVLRTIESIRQESSHSLILTLKDGNADLPYLLTEYHLIIQPGGGYDDPAAGIGTGPYMVETVEHGVRHLFRKFPRYWRDEVGHVDSVELLVINDRTARASALQSGRVHMINLIDPKTARLLGRHPRVNIQASPGRGHYEFYMRTDTPPFDNPDVRLALKYAVDREEMVKRILHGFGSIGNDFPINDAYPLFPDDVPQRRYDPDKAAFHLEKSGHTGPILLRTSDAAFAGAVDAATMFQQHALRAGIELQIKREPADGFFNNVWNVEPFVASYWGGRPVQDLMYSVAYKSDADWNETRWRRPEFDQLLLQARGELDDSKRKSIYREMALMVRDDGGAIIPMFSNFIDATSTNVRGYVRDGAMELSNGLAPIRCWLE
jgi:peptide/nickel transport system substrate-binding protein